MDDYVETMNNRIIFNQNQYGVRPTLSYKQNLFLGGLACR